MVRRILLLVLAASAILIGSAACGSGGGETSGSSGGTAESPPTTSTASDPGSSEMSTTSGPSQRSGVDVCTLVTRDEAASALGADVEPSEPSVQSGFNACTWFQTGGGRGVMVTEVDPAKFRRRLAGEDPLMPAIDRVDGIGDSAYLSGTEDLSWLEFSKNGVAYRVEVFAKPGQVRPGEQQLARQLAARL